MIEKLVDRMKIKEPFGWLVICIFIFLIGLFLGSFSKSIRSVNHEIKSQTIEKKITNEEFSSISKLVADELSSGNLNCPMLGSLRYESCLLFQGALGVWQSSGLKDECPILKINKELPISKILTSEDALRAPSSPCFGYLYSISVSNAVPILISVATKTFKLASKKSFHEPGSDPELCFKGRFGSCGNQAAVALMLFHNAGFKARPVQFYYEENGVRLSHIVPEVFINGKWRLIDTTYGSFWIKNVQKIPFEVASTEEVLDSKINPEIKRFDNNALLPRVFYSQILQQNPFGYLAGTASILRGGVGSIKLKFSNSNGEELFSHKPNYIGDNLSDNNKEGVNYTFESDGGDYLIQLNTLVTGGNEKLINICIDDVCKKFSKDIRNYIFKVKNPKKLYVKSDQDVGYVVLSSLLWDRIK
jgi:hypothetical protein